MVGSEFMCKRVCEHVCLLFEGVIPRGTEGLLALSSGVTPGSAETIPSAENLIGISRMQ